MSDDENPHPYANIRSARRWILAMFCVLLLGTGVTASLAVFLVPLMLAAFIGVPLYYCFASNPMPPGILIYTLAGFEGISCPFWSEADIHCSLLRRRCLRVTETSKTLEKYSIRSENEMCIHVEDDLEEGKTGVYVFSKPFPNSEIFESSQKQSVSDAEDQQGEATDDSDADSIEEGPSSELSTDPSNCACLICLSPFRPDEMVAWSKNEKCPHAYHLDCLVPWIRQKPTCPVCRQNYKIQWALQ